MSLCYTSSKNDTHETFSAYPGLFVQNLICNINENKFAENVKMIFRSCDVDVCGFNTFTNKYWGKKNNKCVCYFHFELSIKEVIDEQSIITITLVTGKNHEVTRLLKQITEGINHYKIMAIKNNAQMNRTNT